MQEIVKHTFKTIILIAVSVLYAACNKETVSSETKESAIVDEKINVSINACLEDLVQADDTRATVKTVVRLEWAEGDKVQAYCGSTKISTDEGLTVTPSKNKLFATLNGTILAPASGSVITFVYSNGCETDGLSFDFSSQNAADIPFVAYGTLPYEGTTITDKIVEFKFATSLVKVFCTALDEDVPVSKAELTKVNTKITITPSEDAAPIVSASNLGTITRTGEGVFRIVDERATFQLAVVNTDAATTREADRSIIVTQGNKEFIAEFSSTEFCSGRAYNTICIFKRNSNIEPINETSVHFSDAAFRDFCLSNYDFDKDGEVSFKEAAKVQYMDCSGLEIKSLEGIERFISLNYLNCSGNPDLKELYLIRGIYRLVSDEGLKISYRKFKSPVFTLIDDDFNPDRVDDLYNICEYLGINCDFALIPYEDIGLVDAVKERVEPYVTAGYEFLVHPWHLYWYDDNLYNKFVDVKHCEESLVNSINTFNTTRGLEKCSYCLVYPGNSSEREEVREMCTKYVWMAITSGGHYNTDLSNPYYMQRLAIDMNLGKDNLKNRIRTAVEKNAWIILGMHISSFALDDTVDDCSWTTGNLIDILEYAQSLGVFKKYSEVVSEFAFE